MSRCGSSTSSTRRSSGVVAAVAEKNPDLAGRPARAGRPRRRHRRAEVRRPVDGSDPRLRLRLGADAVVRRQHGAVPAVRPRPDLLDLPPGGNRAGGRSGRRCPRSRSRRSGRWRCGCSASAASSPRRSSGRARTGCARTSTSWRRTSPRSTSTARCSGPPDAGTRASRLALSDVTARVLARGLHLLGIEAPEQM